MKHLKRAAAMGRNGDTEIGHLTPGEIVVPKSLQTERLMRALMGEAAALGIDLGRYTVGGNDDSRNPKTGAREFSDQGVGEAGSGGGRETGFGGSQIGDAPSDPSKGFWDRVDEPSMVRDVSPPPGMPSSFTYEEDAQAKQYQPRDFFTRARDWAAAQPREFFQDLRDRPISTAVNMALPGVVGLANRAFAAITDVPGAPSRTATDRMIDGIAGFTGFNGPKDSPTQVAEASGKTTGAVGPSGDKSDNEGPASGTADAPYDPTKSGPSGSGLSPLAQALAGMGIRNDGWNNWGRRKTLGSLVSSYDPNGRRYVTPWDYRG